MNRSLLAAATAALVAGPLAVAGGAASLDTVTDSTGKILDLTCEEALATEDAELIEEFCEPHEIPEDGTAVQTTTRKARRTGDAATNTVIKRTRDGGGSGGSPTGPAAPDPQPRTRVGPSGGTFEPVSPDTQRQRPRKRAAAKPAPEQGLGFNMDGPFRPGLRSNSQLTLQPFASPLVSVPPVYELPQIAEQLFGDTTATGVEDPLVATATSADGFATSSADPTGWLAATATGMIMLVGAAHALNGGRTPRRQRA